MDGSRLPWGGLILLLNLVKWNRFLTGRADYRLLLVWQERLVDKLPVRATCTVLTGTMTRPIHGRSQRKCPGRSFVVTAKSCSPSHHITRSRKSVCPRHVSAAGNASIIVKSSLTILLLTCINKRQYMEALNLWFYIVSRLQNVSFINAIKHYLPTDLRRQP
jgi:hypothetical protein